MTKTTRARYTLEFKQEAVRLVERENKRENKRVRHGKNVRYPARLTISRLWRTDL